MKNHNAQNQSILQLIPDDEIAEYARTNQLLKDDNQTTGVLDIENTCKWLGGISRMSLWRLVKKRSLKPAYVGSRPMFRVQDLQSFVKNCKRSKGRTTR